MFLTIGDVVRDRGDMMLGTVVGLVSQSDEQRVAVHVAGSTSGHPVRLCVPYDVEVVARHVGPTTNVRSVLALIAIVVAALAAVLGCQAARAVGAGWLLMFLSGLGSFTAVMTAHEWASRLTGPRRFRV